LGQTLEDPDVLRTTNNLAGALMPDKAVEAEELFRRVFEADRKTLGYDHIHTIISQNNVAQVLSDQGKSEEAVEMMRRTLESSRNVRGDYHPETVDLMDNLREVLRRQGKTEEAEQMLRDRPKVRQTVVEKQEQHDDEGKACRETLALCQTDSERVTALRKLAGLLEQKGRYSEAETILRRSTKLAIDVHGGSNKEVQSDIRGLGVLMSRQRKYKEAEEVFRGLLTKDNASLA